MQQSSIIENMQVNFKQSVLIYRKIWKHPIVSIFFDVSTSIAPLARAITTQILEHRASALNRIWDVESKSGYVCGLRQPATGVEPSVCQPLDGVPPSRTLRPRHCLHDHSSYPATDCANPNDILYFCVFEGFNEIHLVTSSEDSLKQYIWF